jgi:hypothetical protein
MPVLITLMFVAAFAWLHRSVERATPRELAALAASACKKCSKRFGLECARAARERYSAECAAVAAANPGCRINFARAWPMKCPDCGAKTHYNLIGSLTRLVTVLMEQTLSVLKWLGVIAALILALFTAALAVKLPELVATGARAIGAA